MLIDCQGKRDNPINKSLRINLQEGNPPTLHPYVGVDLRSRCLFLALYEPLMRRSASGDLLPAAAEKVEIDPSGTTYTFTLREHYWSNGERVLAQHFEKAWKYALTPGSFCFRADLFYPIKNAIQVKKAELPIDALGIQSVDDQTLVVTLEHPTSYFLDLAASSFFSPLYEIHGQQSNEPSFFNGPYQVHEWLADQRLVLRPNPHYWNKERLDVEEIEFSMVRDPMTAFAMYEKGELDVIGDPYSPLPLELIPKLQEEDLLQSKTISRIFYLLLNTDSYPLNNSSLRKALAWSIDREMLTQHLFFDEIPTYTLVPVTLSSLDGDDVQRLEQDYASAFCQALQEMGLSKETLPPITISYAELSGQKKLAEFIQSQWQQKLGINVKLLCTEWNVHSAHLKQGGYQVGTLHLTTLYSDPMFYLDLFKDKNSLTNYCRWENEQFAHLVKMADHKPEQRQAYLQQAEEILLEEMPAIALFTQNLHYLVRNGVHLEITDLGIYDFNNIYFD